LSASKVKGQDFATLEATLLSSLFAPQYFSLVSSLAGGILYFGGGVRSWFVHFIYILLSFLFHFQPDFDVDHFVSDCRKRVQLEELREDLELYYKLLKTAMVELINKDYADFVNLSTNLVSLTELYYVVQT